MNEMIRRSEWPGNDDTEDLLRKEWLVTNGLGGYASGTIAGVVTRRFHGLLIAALPAPLGRTMMFNHLIELLSLPGGQTVQLCGEGCWPNETPFLPCAAILAEFRLEMGLPVWRYEVGGVTLDKRVVVPQLQNTVHVNYRLISRREPAWIELRPAIHFLPHEGLVSVPPPEPYTLVIVEDRCEIIGEPHYPPLKMRLLGKEASLTLDRGVIKDLFYREEAR